MVESYARWVVQADTLGLADDLLGSVDGIDVEQDITNARLRKLFCVNGQQLALAVLAHEDGYPLLNLWIEQHFELASALSAEIASAFSATTGSDPAETSAFCSEIVDRFRTTTDRPGRMLGLSEGQAVGEPEDLERRRAERIDPLPYVSGSMRQLE